MARISSSRYWFIQIGSVGEATPPEPLILMQCAPGRSSSRTDFRHFDDDDRHRVEHRAGAAAGRLVTRPILELAHVAVAAGHREEPARIEETRPDEQPAPCIRRLRRHRSVLRPSTPEQRSDPRPPVQLSDRGRRPEGPYLVGTFVRSFDGGPFQLYLFRVTHSITG